MSIWVSRFLCYCLCSATGITYREWAPGAKVCCSWFRVVCLLLPKCAVHGTHGFFSSKFSWNRWSSYYVPSGVVMRIEVLLCHMKKKKVQFSFLEFFHLPLWGPVWNTLACFCLHPLKTIICNLYKINFLLSSQKQPLPAWPLRWGQRRLVKHRLVFVTSLIFQILFGKKVNGQVHSRLVWSVCAMLVGQFGSSSGVFLSWCGCLVVAVFGYWAGKVSRMAMLRMKKKGNLSNIRNLGFILYLETYGILIFLCIFVGLFIGYFR